MSGYVLAGDHLAEHPGREAEPGGHSHRLVIDKHEGQFAGHPARVMTSIVAMALSLAFGGETNDAPLRWTETLDNTSTAVWGGVAGTPGYTFKTQASPSDSDDQCRNSKETYTIAAGKRLKASCITQPSSAGNMGLKFGYVTSGGTEIFTADPADGVFFTIDKNSTTLKARVVANSGTAADLATFNLSDGTNAAVADVSATDLVLSIEFEAGADADHTFGWWHVNGVKTPMSAAQLAALLDILATSPATLAAHVGSRVNGTTARTRNFRGVKFDVQL